jgi:hypothetical protein
MSFIRQPLPPFRSGWQVQLCARITWKLKGDSRASRLPGLCRLATSYIDTWEAGLSATHASCEWHGSRSQQHWSCSASRRLPCAELRGMHNIDRLATIPAALGVGMKLFCFGGNVGVELAAFRMKGFIHPHALPLDSPRHVQPPRCPSCFSTVL